MWSNPGIATLITLLGFLPLRILYLLAELFYIPFYYLLRIKRTLLTTNLRNAFPDMPDSKRKRLSSKIYRNTLRVLCENIKAIRISEAALNRRVVLLNPELPVELLRKHKVIIAASAHYANWEWLQLACASQLNIRQATIYKPLRHAGINQMLANMRRRFGSELISSEQPLRSLLALAKKGGAIAINADQLPQPSEEKYWHPFLNQDTAFFPGLEKLARILEAPVIYVEMRPKKIGYYEVEFKLIEKSPQSTAEGSIMNAYIRLIEKQINSEPEYWLWIYKRWKYAPPYVEKHTPVPPSPQ